MALDCDLAKSLTKYIPNQSITKIQKAPKFLWGLFHLFHRIHKHHHEKVGIRLWMLPLYENQGFTIPV